ncbi:MAG: hypothetical protein ACREFO_07945 [Acetobacteraceae bacterium]
MIAALGRAAVSSIASGVAISTGQPQDIRVVLRIQKEVFSAFSSLAYRDSSLPPISALAQEEPARNWLRPPGASGSDAALRSLPPRLA